MSATPSRHIYDARVSHGTVDDAVNMQGVSTRNSPVVTTYATVAHDTELDGRCGRGPYIQYDTILLSQTVT